MSPGLRLSHRYAESPEILPEVPKTRVHLDKIFIRIISFKRAHFLNIGPVSKVSFITHINTLIFFFFSFINLYYFVASNS